jgi:hypothetical protein
VSWAACSGWGLLQALPWLLGRLLRAACETPCSEPIHLPACCPACLACLPLPCSLKEYERQKWVLAGWQEVFVNAVHGQLQNLFLSLCQQLLAAAQVAAPAGLSGSGVGVGSARSTVESAAPFAAVQRRRTLSQSQAEGGEGGGGGGPEPPAALLLLLCKLCSFAEREAVGQALMLLQQLYPERLLSGGEELPAFLPSELGRQLAATSAALLQGYVDSHGCMLALAAATSTQAEDWMHAREPRAPREVCDLILEKVAGEWAGLAWVGGWAVMELPWGKLVDCWVQCCRVLCTAGLLPHSGLLDSCIKVCCLLPWVQRWVWRWPTCPMQTAAAAPVAAAAACTAAAVGCPACTRAPTVAAAAPPGRAPCPLTPTPATAAARQGWMHRALTWKPLSPACCRPHRTGAPGVLLTWVPCCGGRGGR